MLTLVSWRFELNGFHISILIINYNLELQIADPCVKVYLMLILFFLHALSKYYSLYIIIYYSYFLNVLFL